MSLQNYTHTHTPHKCIDIWEFTLIYAKLDAEPSVCVFVEDFSIVQHIYVYCICINWGIVAHSHTWDDDTAPHGISFWNVADYVLRIICAPLYVRLEPIPISMSIQTPLALSVRTSPTVQHHHHHHHPPYILESEH